MTIEGESIMSEIIASSCFVRAVQGWVNLMMMMLVEAHRYFAAENVVFSPLNSARSREREIVKME
jgi:hypothetical protein